MLFKRQQVISFSNNIGFLVGGKFKILEDFYDMAPSQKSINFWSARACPEELSDREYYNIKCYVRPDEACHDMPTLATDLSCSKPVNMPLCDKGVDCDISALVSSDITDDNDNMDDDMPDLISCDEKKSEPIRCTTTLIRCTTTPIRPIYREKYISHKKAAEKPEYLEADSVQFLWKTPKFFADKRIVAIASSECPHQSNRFSCILFLDRKNMVHAYSCDYMGSRSRMPVICRSTISYFYKENIWVIKMLVTKSALIFLCKDGEVYVLRGKDMMFANMAELSKLDFMNVDGKVVDMVSSCDGGMVMYRTNKGEVFKRSEGFGIVWRSRFINKSIIDMAFSGAYILFVSDDGKVYVIDPDEQRKYGRDKRGICNEATLIKFFVEQGIRIRRVALNNSAMLFVSDKGAVYVSVIGEDEKFGLGRQACDSKPKQIDFFSESHLRVADVKLCFSVGYHAFFFTRNGDVYNGDVCINPYPVRNRNIIVRRISPRLPKRMKRIKKIRGLNLSNNCFYQKERLGFLMERGQELVVEEQQQSHTFTLATSKLGLY